MVAVIIIAISILIVAVIAYGAWSRRQVYQKVDELDKRKNSVMNEPIADEISRVKGLTISGETEENFERWRKAWDTIVEDRFQEVELQLFDIEEAANKYQFKKAKQNMAKADENLNKVEEEIAEIRKEVDELVSSEQRNRDEIEAVSEKLKDTRALLSRQHRALGEAVEPIQNDVEDCRKELEKYFEDTETGNYMRARKRLLSMSETIERLNHLMHTIPGLLLEVNVNIPDEIRSLREGMEQLKAQGFEFDHFTIKDDLREIEQAIPELKKAIHVLNTDYSKEQIEKHKDEIETMYDTLEQEVEAKEAVDQGVKGIQNRYKVVGERLKHLEEQRKQVKESYHLPEQETNLYEQMKKELQDAEKEQRVFEDLKENKKQAFTDLRVTLAKLEERMATIESDVNDSITRLDELRSDELRAYEELGSLRKKMMETQLKVQKSHLPAVPEPLVSQLEDANKELEKATALLEMSPLEMKAVQEALELGQHQVGKADHTVNQTIKDAAWAERLLQFGNRYRSEYRELGNVLNESEWNFRNGYFDETIEKLTAALNDYVPVALGHLESSWDEKESERKSYQHT